MRGHFENDAHVLVFKACTLGTNCRYLVKIRNWHLLTYEKPAGLIIADIDLRLGQHLRIGGAAQELDEKIHADGAVEHARSQGSQALQKIAGSGWRRINGAQTAEALLVSGPAMPQK